ncbi:polysaccharide deacetylase [Perkinsela sp. CCAP 1560/4]|nr:polysaccharide deacetylase [Perkinsela sp. CCAP 1560/4]|eukprot:KNH07772.1 polysaccharide deacetylase [Perkinsela sp. CCAP 1560/4]
MHIGPKKIIVPFNRIFLRLFPVHQLFIFSAFLVCCSGIRCEENSEVPTDGNMKTHGHTESPELKKTVDEQTTSSGQIEETSTWGQWLKSFICDESNPEVKENTDDILSDEDILEPVEVKQPPAAEEGLQEKEKIVFEPKRNVKAAIVIVTVLVVLVITLPAIWRVFFAIPGKETLPSENPIVSA